MTNEMTEHIIAFNSDEMAVLESLNRCLVNSGRPDMVHERVVRCKECEFFESGYTDGVMFDENVCWAWVSCNDYPTFTTPLGYCWRGKRRED